MDGDGFLKIGRDVTRQRETADRQRVLIAELRHRTSNLMAVVRRIGEQTLRSSKDLREFEPKFRDRIEALARAQGLLSRMNEDERVDFDELLGSELSALGGSERLGSQITLEGPEGVALRSGSVQTLALALHELCTNALKYGALHQPEGRLAIRWDVRREGGQSWLHVDWRESGVAMPSPDGPPKGRGGGRELIERALPYQLGANTSYVMEPDGVHCTIALVISETSAVRENVRA